MSARPAPPRLALRPAEAADALGVSRDHFDRFVGPELAWVRTGRVKVVAIAEIERYLRASATVVLGDR